MGVPLGVPFQATQIVVCPLGVPLALLNNCFQIPFVSHSHFKLPILHKLQCNNAVSQGFVPAIPCSTWFKRNPGQGLVPLCNFPQTQVQRHRPPSASPFLFSSFLLLAFGSQVDPSSGEAALREHGQHAHGFGLLPVGHRPQRAAAHRLPAAAGAWHRPDVPANNPAGLFVIIYI